MNFFHHKGLGNHLLQLCPKVVIHPVYVGLPKKFREFDHKKKFLTITPSFHHLLWSSPLGHVYSDPSIFPGISCIPVSSQMWVSITLCFCMNLLSCVKMMPFQPYIISSWGIGKIRRGWGQVNGGGNHCNVFGSHELSNKWCVSGHVVMVEKPIVFLPLVWVCRMPSLSCFKTSQYNLTLMVWPGGMNPLWIMPWMSKKTINMDLTLLWTWRAFFGCGEFGDFHCDDCWLVSGS